VTAALALAFSAGMVATVNPCGFAMLPAYLSYFMGLQEGARSQSAAMRAALKVGAIVSLGFLVVFGIAGIAITALSRSVAADWIPWLALAVGIGIAILGAAMLFFGYELTVGLPKAKQARLGSGYGKVFGFGVSYAIASLSCTLPVFLTVVATQITLRSFGGGLVIFVAYGIGMSTVLMGLTVIVALGKQGVLNKVRASARYVNRVSGAILIAAGAWIVWFWTTAITSGAGALSASSGFQFFENLSQTLLNFVANNTLFVAVSFLVVIGGAVAIALRRGSDAAIETESVVGERVAR